MNNIEFKKYSDIELVHRTAEVQKIMQQGHADGEWVVTEKIHGANFSFWFDGSSVRCASRGDWLDENANFFNWQAVRDRCSDTLFRIFAQIKGYVANDLRYITVYGELCGGAYPHPDVPRVPSAKKLQKGVYYHPDNQFVAYDITLHYGEHDDIVHEVQNHDFVYGICESFGVPHAPVLFRGTFRECAEYANEFDTKVPQCFGLPKIENNIAEGYVMKPAVPKFFWGGGRVMLKNKCEKWSEKANERKRAPVDRSEEYVPSEEVLCLLDELLAMVTENRLRGVLSKMSDITDQKFGEIVGNTGRDALNDFLKDYGARFDALDQKDRKYITKALNGEVSTMVRKNFVNIIDGEF
jgi:Rnl2 family RNA ligase